jgi:hypothetical protein
MSRRITELFTKKGGRSQLQSTSKTAKSDKIQSPSSANLSAQNSVRVLSTEEETKITNRIIEILKSEDENKIQSLRNIPDLNALSTLDLGSNDLGDGTC